MTNEEDLEGKEKQNLAYLRNLEVALAHDYLLYLGGAEKTLKEITRIFPKSPIFTLSIAERMLKIYPGNLVRSSFLNRVSKIIPHQWLLPFYPVAIESIDLREFDLVVSSTSAFMKGLVIKPKTTHVCYCHTPTRYLWDTHEEYLEQGPYLHRTLSNTFVTRMILNYLRIWDQEAAKRVDYFIANSNYTAKRIKKYYKRKSKVIYPPVAVEKFNLSRDRGDYFLVVSRLSAYKKVNLVVEAFNRLGFPLIIAGKGQEIRQLKKMAMPNIKFLGFVKEKNLPKLYAGAKAFIFPCEDDFGITMVEAMASGKPVLAFGSGGALEIVEPGKTGEFFYAPEVEILVDGLRRLIENEKNYSPTYIRQRSLRFSKEIFRKKLIEFLAEVASKEKILNK